MFVSKLKCLFDHHDYTIPILGETRCILICKYCRRFGYYQHADGEREWYELDDVNGLNLKRRVYSDGYEVCWGLDRFMIYLKKTDGSEFWYDGKGNTDKHIIRKRIVL